MHYEGAKQIINTQGKDYGQQFSAHLGNRLFPGWKFSSFSQNWAHGSDVVGGICSLNHEFRFLAQVHFLATKTSILLGQWIRTVRSLVSEKVFLIDSPLEAILWIGQIRIWGTFATFHKSQMQCASHKRIDYREPFLSLFQTFVYAKCLWNS